MVCSGQCKKEEREPGGGRGGKGKGKDKVRIFLICSLLCSSLVGDFWGSESVSLLVSLLGREREVIDTLYHLYLYYSYS